MKLAKELCARATEAISADCIGFTERHGDMLAPLDIPVIAVVAKAVGGLFGG